MYSNFSPFLLLRKRLGIAGNSNVHMIKNLVLPPHKGIQDFGRRSVIINGHDSRNLAATNKVNLVQSHAGKDFLWQFFWFLCLDC